MTSLVTLTQTVIEVRALSKVYWDGGWRLEILKNISLAVEEGEGVAILGPSGSGKTTLLNLLAGLDKPSAGSIFLNGKATQGLSAGAWARIRNEKLGLVFQSYHLLSELTARENVLLPALFYPKRSRRENNIRAEELLRRVGLGSRLGHFPAQLSGGERQRVAIARALVNDPEIVLCDEPTGNLDLGTGAEIAELLRSLSKAHGKTVLTVTHDERIAKGADRVLELPKLNEG